MGRLRVYGRIARVLLVVALGLSMASVFGLFERLGVANSMVRRQRWSRFFMARLSNALPFRVTVHGELPQTQMLLVSNHVSWTDIPLLGMVTPMSFLSKAEVLNQGGYSYLMGCASIPMHDGGIQAHAIMQRLRERYLCNEHLRAEPKKPLPALDLPSNVIAEMPPLLKAYMRLGAKICGEPCWDEDFQVADVFILLKRDELCPRYARHFKAAM